ncbi:hypothetical protein C475_18183 [Halosimplex carlsbadense 2-9-1]|uniref:Uncharacterized protein n=1 Tax=Halosimplex carlsbadense 2-9-1 TaxID=797114 RepID=M0CJD2_9EURY|nr:hypothetical protein [Halosimplex carlsbadense]ELZ22467.1 hypothetical protein C475_18183 [Halosimplex carlsbadense 2-9-1]
MAALPDDRTAPGSVDGTLVDLGWMVTGVLVFGSLVVFEPLFVSVDPTPATVAGSALAGVVVGTAVVVLSVESERARSFWAESGRRRFVVLFAFIMGMQAVFRLFPGLTVLSALVAFLVAIPARLVSYYRHRDRQ